MLPSPPSRSRRRIAAAVNILERTVIATTVAALARSATGAERTPYYLYGHASEFLGSGVFMGTATGGPGAIGRRRGLRAGQRSCIR
jgi:hypothetical protein